MMAVHINITDDRLNEQVFDARAFLKSPMSNELSESCVHSPSQSELFSLPVYYT